MRWEKCNWLNFSEFNQNCEFLCIFLFLIFITQDKDLPSSISHEDFTTLVLTTEGNPFRFKNTDKLTDLLKHENVEHI